MRLTGLQQTGMQQCVLSHSAVSLCDLMDCSSPGSSVHGTFQARILEWGAISSSRGSSLCSRWACSRRVCSRPAGRGRRCSRRAGSKTAGHMRPGRSSYRLVGSRSWTHSSLGRRGGSGGGPGCSSWGRSRGPCSSSLNSCPPPSIRRSWCRSHRTRADRSGCSKVEAAMVVVEGLEEGEDVSVCVSV